MRVAVQVILNFLFVLAMVMIVNALVTGGYSFSCGAAVNGGFKFERQSPSIVPMDDFRGKT